MDMEIGDLGHLSSDIIVQMLMLYATSPLARQLYDKLMTGDPFNIDIRLDDESANRNAEIVETCLKEIGKRIVFRKVRKQLKRPIEYHPITYRMDDPKDWDPIIFFGEGNAPYPALEEMRKNPSYWPITFNPIMWLLPPEDAKKRIQEDAEALRLKMEQWRKEHP